MGLWTRCIDRILILTLYLSFPQAPVVLFLYKWCHSGFKRRRGTSALLKIHLYSIVCDVKNEYEDLLYRPIKSFLVMSGLFLSFYSIFAGQGLRSFARIKGTGRNPWVVKMLVVIKPRFMLNVLVLRYIHLIPMNWRTELHVYASNHEKDNYIKHCAYKFVEMC